MMIVLIVVGVLALCCCGSCVTTAFMNLDNLKNFMK
jgi:hypothetical protein